uniref:helix-turn-helix domain-containing protein n=1 Tax=Arthrobacter silvisoli TaxID=2291022 RepID=UPI003F4908A1
MSKHHGDDEFDPAEALLRIEALIRQVSGFQRTAADFYTIEELAATFKISRSAVYRLRKEQNWPHHRFGHEIRFSTQNVEQIRAMYDKQPPAPPEQPRRAPRIGTRAQKK